MSGNERMILGRRAYTNAINALIGMHQQDWVDVLGKARVELGLPPEQAPKKSYSKKSRLQVLREQLRAAGIEPNV